MSNLPPPLPGEPIGSLPYAADRGREDAPFWLLFRIGLIFWSATVLVRHATYWIGLQPGGTPVAILLVVLEVIVLLGVLVAAGMAGQTGPTRGMLVTLAALGAAYVLVSLCGFAVDVTRVPMPPMRLLWSFVSRAQLWVMPILAVIAMVRGAPAH